MNITGTVNGEPVMVLIGPEHYEILVELIASIGPTKKCRLVKLDPKKYDLSKPSFLKANSAISDGQNEERL